MITSISTHGCGDGYFYTNLSTENIWKNQNNVSKFVGRYYRAIVFEEFRGQNPREGGKKSIENWYLILLILNNHLLRNKLWPMSRLQGSRRQWLRR